MELLADAIEEAELLGYLPPDEQSLKMLPVPGWLAALQKPGGVDTLEVSLGVVIPGAIREFWARPDLVRVLNSWRWSDFFDRRPVLAGWGGGGYLVFMSNPHSGEVGAVQLGADDPPIFIGWEYQEEAPLKVANQFSEYILDYIEAGPEGAW